MKSKGESRDGDVMMDQGKRGMKKKKDILVACLATLKEGVSEVGR